MATSNQNNPRAQATIEFDKRLEKLYLKHLKEFERSFQKSLTRFDFDIAKIIVPNSNEMQDESFARKYNKRRNKILDSVDQLVRSMVVSRNKISIADMFDSNVSNANFSKRYNKVRRIALNRLETGVGLLKFERHAEIPFSTFLFPSRNSELYITRYNLLKHRILSKVKKGIQNITFVAETIKGRLKSKVFLEREKAQIPIDSFLIPTPNSNLFALRYNWLKHMMLSKAYYGIKHISFVSESFKGRVKSRVFLERKKAEIPIDSFLIPSGNSIFYNVRYELLKLKLLGKIKSGIRHLTFKKSEDVDILKYFFPSEGDSNYDPKFRSEIVDELKRGMRKHFKERNNAVRRESKANEFSIFKQNEFERQKMELDVERNKLLRIIAFGGFNRNAVTDMRRNSNGVWTAAGDSTTSGINSVVAGATGAGATGAGTAVAMSKHRSLSNAIKAFKSSVLGGATLASLPFLFIPGDTPVNKQTSSPKGAYAEQQARADALRKMSPKGLISVEGKGHKLLSENPELKDIFIGKMFEQYGANQTMDQFILSNPIAALQILKYAEEQYKNGKHVKYFGIGLETQNTMDKLYSAPNPILLNPPISAPAGAAEYFMQGTSNLNMPGMQTLIELQAENNKMMKNMQGTTIINSRSNSWFNYGSSLDSYILSTGQ